MRPDVVPDPLERSRPDRATGRGAVVCLGVVVLLTGCSTTGPGRALSPASSPPSTASTQGEAGAPRDHGVAPVPPEPLAVPAVDAPAPAVVAWWDEQRRRAWTEGDPALLHSLYAPGSRAGEVDVDNLAAYVDAGVRLRGWQTRRGAVREVARGGEVLTAVVTTRQQQATVALAGGGAGVDRDLPASPAQRLQVSLRWSDQVGWRVAEVRPVSPSRPAGPRGAPARHRGGRS